MSTPPDLATASPWLTAAEAAAYLRLATVGALYKRIERGQVRAYRDGRRFLFRRSDLDGLVTSNPVSAVASRED